MPKDYTNDLEYDIVNVKNTNIVNEFVKLINHVIF